MSEWINNRAGLDDQQRRAGLKQIIRRLHAGEDLAAVKADFTRITAGISGDEIARLETELVAEGLPVAEVQRMCDVHADVFRDQLTHKDDGRDLDEIPGHPIQTLIRENQAATELIRSEAEPRVLAFAAPMLTELLTEVEKLLSDFRAGVKDQEDFWIRMGERTIMIRYYAVRAQDGRYLGTLEVTQDIAPLQAIAGQKRILS